jgi:hypothetical protein
MGRGVPCECGAQPVGLTTPEPQSRTHRADKKEPRWTFRRDCRAAGDDGDHRGPVVPGFPEG